MKPLRPRIRLACFVSLFTFYSSLFSAPAPSAEQSYDVIVFGATSAGVTAAVAAGRAGEKVLLLESGYLIGGMMTGGLTKTDIGKRETIGGLSQEFFDRVREYNKNAYGANSEQVKAVGAALIFEPKVAGIVFMQMLTEAGVTVRTHEQLAKSYVTDGVIRKITTRNYQTGETLAYSAPVFVDGTYEGDLMAASGVLYRVGREARSEYNESLAGITKGPAEYIGKSDHRLQSYNIRGTLTIRDDIRVPIPKPDNYDPEPFENFVQIVLKHNIKDITVLFDDYQRWGMINGKCDPNKADMLDINMAYPESDYEGRARIVKRVQDHWLSLWWMLQNDPRLPEEFKQSARKWGLPADEYTESGHVTPQLYIRVARRMMGRYFLTQRDCEYDRFKPDAICMGSYNMDSHASQHFWIDKGRVEEGHFNQSTDPYEIPYRSITPYGVKNLLVVAAISASNVAYSSLRMEPVFMMLGEAGGSAAHLARAGKTSVQDVSIKQLQTALKKSGVPLEAPYRPVASIRVKTPPPYTLGQTIEFEAQEDVARLPLTKLSWCFDGSGAVQATGKNVKWTILVEGTCKVALIAQDAKNNTALPAYADIQSGVSEKPATIEVHYEDAKLKGRWKRTRGTDIEYRQRVGLVDEAEGDGSCTARFATKLPASGRYVVAVAWPISGNRATSVPVTIAHAGGEAKLTVNQRARKAGPFTFVPLGEYEFDALKEAVVTISNAGAKGYVAIDAVRFIPVPANAKNAR